MINLNIEQEINRIIDFIKKIFKKSNAKGILLGISGGIDSATTAALCTRAIGKDNMLSLILPCHSNDNDLKDARIVANYLGIKHITVNLNKTYDIFLKTFENINDFKNVNLDIPRANLKARLRMCSVYYFANLLNYLVAGTGNKSEDDIGYFTKYGDGGVDFLPIQHLYKHEVREVARFLKIPDKIIERKPTAGLWKGQTDEDELSKQLGFTITYDKLDEMLMNIANGKFDMHNGEYKNLMQLMKKNRHKIELPPNLQRKNEN